MKSIVFAGLAIALSGCTAPGQDGTSVRAMRVTATEAVSAPAASPLTGAQLAWMRARITTTATNPVIPRPPEEGDGPMQYKGRAFAPSMATAVESQGRTGTPEALIAEVVKPAVRAWAADAVLANAYQYPFRGYYNGDVPLSWRESEAVILKVFGWPLAYTSKSRLETLLVYVAEDKTLVVRVQAGLSEL